jgi:hypothetical protein
MLAVRTWHLVLDLFVCAKEESKTYLKRNLGILNILPIRRYF